MIISFSVSKYPAAEEEKEILSFIRAYDQDYADLMEQSAPHMKGQIEWSMLKNGEGWKVLSPEVPDEQARSFVFNLMQKPWCFHIFEPGKNPSSQYMLRASKHDGTRITEQLANFMLGGLPQGTVGLTLLYTDYARGADVAMALEDFAPSKGFAPHSHQNI